MSLFRSASRSRNEFVTLFLRETEGSELVEFALSVTLLLMMIFGVIDGTRVVYAHHFVAQAASAGVRYATTHGSTWSNACANATAPSCVASAANISDFVLETITAGVSPGNLTTVPTWTGTTPAGDDCSTSHIINAPGCMVSVKVTYIFQFTLPFLPHSTVTMSSTASSVVQQ